MPGGIINTVFALVIAVILIWILWSLAIYFSEMGSEEGKKEGKAFILASTTSLFVVMVIYWLVQWIRAATGI